MVAMQNGGQDRGVGVGIVKLQRGWGSSLGGGLIWRLGMFEFEIRFFKIFDGAR